jgi:hypothetical protein
MRVMAAMLRSGEAWREEAELPQTPALDQQEKTKTKTKTSDKE